MDNWAQIEFLFLYKLRVSKYDLRKLEFWDVEETLELWKEQMEREKKENDKQNKKYNTQASPGTSPKPSQYKAPNMPSPTNYGGFNVPKLNIPKM